MSNRYCSIPNALLAAASLFATVAPSAPACAQDANALAAIQEVRAGGQKACATGKKYTIAFSHSISEAAIVKAVRRFADIRAAELGCVTMLHDNTQANNLEQQVNAVQSWVTQGVDAIVVTPIDEQALKPLQLQAQKKGIKWLTYLGKMSQSDGYVSFNHSQSGQLVANAAVQWVKGNHIKDPIALVTTLTGLPSIAPRWTEVERIFAANGIRIVAKIDQDSADQTSGLKAAETVLKQYPNLNIIIGINDDSAVGALRAVELAGIARRVQGVGGHPHQRTWREHRRPGVERRRRNGSDGRRNSHRARLEKRSGPAGQAPQELSALTVFQPCGFEKSCVPFFLISLSLAPLSSQQPASPA